MLEIVSYVRMYDCSLKGNNFDVWLIHPKQFINRFYKSEVCTKNISIDINRLRRYKALEFRLPVTKGKNSVKRSLYKALHKRLSLPAQLVTDLF